MLIRTESLPFTSSTMNYLPVILTFDSIQVEIFFFSYFSYDAVSMSECNVEWYDDS